MTLHFAFSGTADAAEPSGTAGALASTGADLARQAAIGLALVLLGVVLSLGSRHARRREGGGP